MVMMRMNITRAASRYPSAIQKPQRTSQRMFRITRTSRAYPRSPPEARREAVYLEAARSRPLAHPPIAPHAKWNEDGQYPADPGQRPGQRVGRAGTEREATGGIGGQRDRTELREGLQPVRHAGHGNE